MTAKFNQAPAVTKKEPDENQIHQDRDLTALEEPKLPAEAEQSHKQETS